MAESWKIKKWWFRIRGLSHSARDGKQVQNWRYYTESVGKDWRRNEDEYAVIAFILQKSNQNNLIIVLLKPSTKAMPHNSTTNEKITYSSF